MPAWMTSELRELVCVPIASSASSTMTSRPASASSRAIARPTTPAPTTTASTRSKLGLDSNEAQKGNRALTPIATLTNWREAPYNRWAFHHVRELIPSADIAHDPRRVRELAARPRELAIRIEPDGGEPLTLAQFLAETQTDGFVILHRGAL